MITVLGGTFGPEGLSVPNTPYSTSGRAVLYFLARPPIRAFCLGEVRETGRSDTF